MAWTGRNPDESDPTNAIRTGPVTTDNPTNALHRGCLAATCRRKSTATAVITAGSMKAGALKAAGRPGDKFGSVCAWHHADPGGWIRMSSRTTAHRKCYLGDPQVVNMSPVGLADSSTLLSWLSQWIYDEAHGDGVDCGLDIGGAGSVIGPLDDTPATPSHTRLLFDANRSSRQGDARNRGATHYLRRPRSAGQVAVRPSTSSPTGWFARDFAGTNDTPHRPPALVIGNLADDAFTPSHTRRLFPSNRSSPTEMH